MSKTARKFFTIFLLASLVLGGGFSCKGLSAEEKSAIQPVSLEYWTVVDDVDALKTLINQYTASRSYITVTVRQLKEDEIYTRLIEALAEDKGPDIISIHNRQLATYLSKLEPMPSAVSDATVQVIKKKLGTETVVNTSVVVMPTAQQIDSEYVQVVKDDVISGGKIYGLPLSLDTMAIYYNKDLLDRAGIAQAPKTWAEFQTAVKKLTKYDKDNNIVQSGAALGVGSNVEGFDDILFMLFEQSGLTFVDSNGYLVFNSPSTGSTISNSAISVMNFYTDYANPNKDVYTWNSKMNNALTDFVGGKVGFFFGYSYHNARIKALAPQLNVRTIPMLQLNPSKPVNVANYWVQSVVKKSTNKNEAWALINYLAHSQATKTYLDTTGRPTAMRAFITEQSSKTALEPFVSQVLVAKNWYQGRGYSTAKQALSDMLDQWLKVSPTSAQRINSYNEIIGRAAARVNQTL